MKNFKLSIVGLVVLFLFVFVGTVKTEAFDGTLSSSTFKSLNQSGVVGYIAGFDLSGGIFNDADSIVIKLYKDNTLLQTNTALSSKMTGTGFLTPFDVSGSFDYVKDGYFTNKRESEYGKNLTPNKVVATVSFKDGTVLTSTNSSLNGSPSQMVLGVNKFNFSGNMKMGSKGVEISELQKFLNNKGYDCGLADGGFGPKTKACVVKFQLDNGLIGDGLIGPQTRTVLNK